MRRHIGVIIEIFLTPRNTRLDKKVLSTTTNRASIEEDSKFSQPHLRNGRPISAPHSNIPVKRCDGGDAMCDAQADVPSAKRLRAQLAFKNSMVHGILQFTPSIAFCYVLHRCVSRDIRCRESFMIYKEARFNAITANGKAWNKQFLSLYFLGTFRAGGLLLCRRYVLRKPKGLAKDARQHGILRIGQEPNT